MLTARTVKSVIVYLVGRRGSGKTTLAHALKEHGFKRIHPASIADELGLQKDAEGSYIGVEPHLIAEVLTAGPLVVVDGAPRTPSQRDVVIQLAPARPFCVVELDACKELSEERMRSRGNTEEVILRAHRRWLSTEAPTAALFERLVLSASLPVEELVAVVLAEAKRLNTAGSGGG